MKKIHPWGSFLKSRYYAMLWMRDEMGYDNDRISHNMCMDSTQVSLILRYNIKKIFPDHYYEDKE